MKVTETAAASDAGRTRRRNEDAYAVEPPLLVVADGMGGARAGEVASRIAVAAFREFHEADAMEPEARLAAIVQEANRRIYERAAADVNASGMGTTITAALVEGDRVAVGHVGDSRAYLLREGTFEQLTDDHSLVADLMRSGQLTPEEAEAHPQRSVITRALGTDPDVDVDTFSLELKAGDVVLLCSDGLTTMLSDEDIAELVARPSLGEAAKALVSAANRRGGEDNITVVLARVGGDGEDTLAMTTTDTNGAGAAELEDTLTGLEPVAEPPPDQTLLHVPAVSARPAERAPRVRWRRGAIIVLVALVVVLAVLAAALWGMSRANFVGVDDEGHFVVYQGVPWDLGGDVRLYRERYVSQLLAEQLSPAERASLLDHELTSYSKARKKLRVYEREGVP
jgi:serine/threonine protein phosphatase PrpC